METEDRVVGGRYRLRGRLGAGAMGAVWRAEDLVLGRDVAVKEVVFPPGIRPEEMEVLRERTRREARSAARLDHPSAVTVYDVVEEHGRPWLVMELVEARTLAEVVTDDGPLAPQRVAHIGLAVLGALEAAHRQGIVHRDVKPGNVMLTEAGRIVLTDFGIATSADDSSLTGTGLLLGSPAYIAPERARGNAPGPASDLWSLGATLFTAVEGRPPYDGKDALETVTSVVTGDHAPFVAAGPLTQVLDGLLVKDPERRLDATQARRMLFAASGASPAPTARPRPVRARTDAGTAALHLGEVAADVREVEAHDHHSDDHDDHATSAMRLQAPPSGRPRPPRPPRVVRQTSSPHRRRSPVMPLVTAGVLLALAAGGLAYSVLTGEDGSSRAADPSASSSASPTPTGQVSVPAGWDTYEDDAGWTVSAPASFVRTTTSRGEVQLKDPDTRATLRVRVTSPAPADLAALTAATARRYQNLGQYAEINQAPPDLEFTFYDTVSLHVLDRSVIANGKGYSLYWQTPADEWQAQRSLLDQVIATFRPAPAG